MQEKLFFGPAGIGGVKEAVSNLEHYNKLGLKACEIAFTYGIYIKQKKDAKEIRKAAKKLGIKLSIHAPYWINLNGAEKKKIEESKKRILDCCKVGEYLGAEMIVFHPGYYGKMGKEETFQNIKKVILEIIHELKRDGLKIKMGAETTGKINVFGSVDEIERLVKETGCACCIDFAHIRAREKNIDYESILEKLSSSKIHIHFSGIEYGEKGERRHIRTNKEELKELIVNLKKYSKAKEIVIINESPSPVEDSVLGLKIVH